MKMNMGDALPRNAQRFPNKLAIVEERRKLTHLDLHLRTNRLANYLLRHGVGPGERVALACGNRSEHLEIIFALAKIGVTAIPFDYHWSLGEYEAVFGRAGFKVRTLSVPTLPLAVGDMTAILSIADNTSDSPQLVSLSGAGISPPGTGGCTLAAAAHVSSMIGALAFLAVIVLAGWALKRTV